MEIVFGANPTESDLREIVRRIEAKLPQDDGALRLTPSAMDAFEERIYQRVAQALASATPEPTTDAAKPPRVAKK